MDEGTVGIIVLTAIATIVAGTGHWRSSRYGLTTLVTGVIAIAVFLIIVVLRGDADPFSAIAAIVGGIYSVLIAAIVGLPFLWIRSRTVDFN